MSFTPLVELCHNLILQIKRLEKALVCSSRAKPWHFNVHRSIDDASAEIGSLLRMAMAKFWDVHSNTEAKQRCYAKAMGRKNSIDKNQNSSKQNTTKTLQTPKTAHRRNNTKTQNAKNPTSVEG